MGFYFTKSVKAISLSINFKQIKARLINHLKKQMKKEETKEFSKSVVSPFENGRSFYSVTKSFVPTWYSCKSIFSWLKTQEEN